MYTHKSSEYNDVRYPLRSIARYLMKRIRLMDNSFYARDMMYDEPDDPATSFCMSGVKKQLAAVLLIRRVSLSIYSTFIALV